MAIDVSEAVSCDEGQVDRIVSDVGLRISFSHRIFQAGTEPSFILGIVFGHGTTLKYSGDRIGNCFLFLAAQSKSAIAGC